MNDLISESTVLHLRTSHLENEKVEQYTIKITGRPPKLGHTRPLADLPEPKQDEEIIGIYKSGRCLKSKQPSQPLATCTACEDFQRSILKCADKLCWQERLDAFTRHLDIEHAECSDQFQEVNRHYSFVKQNKSYRYSSIFSHDNVHQGIRLTIVQSEGSGLLHYIRDQGNLLFNVIESQA